MKYIALGGIIIFWTFAVGLLSAGLVLQQMQQSPGTTPTNQLSQGQGLPQFSLVDVSEHNNAQDCWLAIDGGVYDVSSYISAHPGGAGTIIPSCGKEASQSFATKGGEGAHSQNAWALLGQYQIGILPSSSTSQQSTQTSVNQEKTQQTTTSANTNTGILLSTQEVASHTSISDCWLIISQKVYNVTSYITSHPGGIGAITPYCGKEATQAFATKGGSGSHSQTAYNILASYYIGDLNTQTSSQRINSTTAQTPPPSRGDDEDDDD